MVTGATGLVGSKLLEQLDRPLITSRNAERAKQKLGTQVRDVIPWDGNQPIEIDPDVSIDAVINLMGEPIAQGRWNADKKNRIRSSRVDGTRNLIQGIAQLRTPPKILVSASAVGYYGSRGDQVLDEDQDAGSGFLPEVCSQWEAAADEAQALGIKVAKIRIGLVCATEGGVIAELAPKFRGFLGARLGSGKQYVPWIHVDDLVQLMLFCIEHQLDGALNGSAPNPVTNAEFTKSLAKAVGRPALMVAPKFALKMVFGEFAESLFFSQRAIPKAALDHGFQFRFENLDDALADLL